MATRKPQAALSSTPRLLDCRFLTIHAEVGPDPDGMGRGGILQLKINAALTEMPAKIKDDKFFAKVDINLIGLPKGVDPKSEVFAFKIHLIAAGMFQFTALNDSTVNRKTGYIATDLCQQLYPLAVAEAKMIAQKLGFGNLDIPWQLGQQSMPRSAAKAKSSRSITSLKKKAT